MPETENPSFPVSQTDIDLARSLKDHQEEPVRRLADAYLALSEPIAAALEQGEETWSKQVKDAKDWLRSDA